jgi:hypothetical protein
VLKQRNLIPATKMQLCRILVKYLGYDITSEGHALSKHRSEAIKALPKPITKQHMMSIRSRGVLQAMV